MPPRHTAYKYDATWLVVDDNGNPLVHTVRHGMRDRYGRDVSIQGLASSRPLKQGQLLGYYYGVILKPDQNDPVYRLTLTKPPPWWPKGQAFDAVHGEATDGRYSLLRLMNAPYAGSPGNVAMDRDGGYWVKSDVDADTVLLVDYGPDYWTAQKNLRYRPVTIAPPPPLRRTPAIKRKRSVYDQTGASEIRPLVRSNGDQILVERLQNRLAAASSSVELLHRADEAAQIKKVIKRTAKETIDLEAVRGALLGVSTINTMTHIVAVSRESLPPRVVGLMLFRYNELLDANPNTNMFKHTDKILVLNQALLRMYHYVMTLDERIQRRVYDCVQCIMNRFEVLVENDGFTYDFADGLITAIRIMLDQYVANPDPNSHHATIAWFGVGCIGSIIIARLEGPVDMRWTRLVNRIFNETNFPRANARMRYPDEHGDAITKMRARIRQGSSVFQTPLDNTR